MSERTARLCLHKFCQWVIKLYSKRYLRKPNANDVQKLYQAQEQRHGFPGMLGSIDCMHWPWQNCPVSWKGQYTRGDHGHPTIILEAVASQDLWIWHAFFALPGSLNDLNIIYQSQIFEDVVAGTGPDISFTVSGVEYRRGYYLADGIYPTYSTIVKTIPYPTDDKRKKFAKFQEGARKDIERAFGVLQKNGKSLNIQHVRLHQSGYETLCTLVSSFITWSLKTNVERYASTMKTRLVEILFQLVGNNKI
ncbi:putative harbinger transposase-derived protein [Helianthus annuus]|nr:putative harbinger transposase-derived protein [Helianthus annuus]